MAEFKAEVVRLKIEEHSNADALELAVIGGYRAVVRKGQFQTNDLAVYIPEQAVLPEWIIKELGLEGRLAGKLKNRVKAQKIRGTLSQGLVYPVYDHEKYNNYIVLDNGYKLYNVNEGQDVTEELGIVKWEPPIPVHMSGQVWNAMGRTIKFDIENWKNHPTVIKEGEDVIFTEKGHGTFCAMGIQNPNDLTYVVYSKGLGAKGLAFKLNAANSNNLYVRMFNQVGQQIVDELSHILAKHSNIKTFMVMGEIMGKGVQDLNYGFMQPEFKIFDIYVGTPNDGYFLPSRNVRYMIKALNENGVNCEYMPVLYEGPFSVEEMEMYTDGKETISGKHMHIREGIVIRTDSEREDENLGRVILKSVSGDYLTRKGNVTEYN